MYSFREAWIPSKFRSSYKPWAKAYGRNFSFNSRGWIDLKGKSDYKFKK
jgi:hypothetical protein